MAEINGDIEREAARTNSMETARGRAEFNADIKREAAWPSSMETPRRKPRLDKRTARSKRVQAS